MTMFHGLGMFIFGMGALIVGAIVAYFIINQVMKDDEEKTININILLVHRSRTTEHGSMM